MTRAWLPGRPLTPTLSPGRGSKSGRIFEGEGCSVEGPVEEAEGLGGVVVEGEGFGGAGVGDAVGGDAAGVDGAGVDEGQGLFHRP